MNYVFKMPESECPSSPTLEEKETFKSFVNTVVLCFIDTLQLNSPLSHISSHKKKLFSCELTLISLPFECICSQVADRLSSLFL